MTDGSQFLPAVVGGLGALLASVAGVVVARRRFLIVDVAGDSMVPSLAHGDRVLVRRTRRLRTGAIVVAHHQEGGRRTAAGSGASAWLVKRLAALPGDGIPEAVAPAVDAEVRRVPAGMAVLLGEHPGSVDSRRWGFVPLSDIKGVVVRRLRPGAG
ncbi:hypothetical protein DDE19_07735 [Micromonospora ureilytica]|uniref:Peptidase S26 domain-containing protein n=1 Tax=Micromonospora ureilytica TaxID=709868 RepID=A0A3N9Y0E7_9ACTN|nr:S26 family signal peptidase [Micromonospora ureilytica]RQX18434.1 hypothetical protein DDE19_07735 [Micromonospora ureilytica]